MSFIASLAVLTVLGTLLLSVAEHLARPSSLPRALTAQRVLSRPLVRPVAASAVTLEGLLAVAGVLAVGVGRDALPLLRVVLAVGAVLFLLYAGYTRHLLRARPGAPCGCSAGDTEVSGWVVGRAVSLAALAALGLLLSDRLVAPEQSMARFGVALTASIAFALLLWHLPDAMHDPLQAALRQQRQQVLAGAGGRGSRP